MLPCNPPPPQVMDAVNVSAFLQEAALMTRLADGPHVVALHGACVDDQALVVVMELMEVSSLLGLFFAHGTAGWTVLMLSALCSCSCQQLAYCCGQSSCRSLLQITHLQLC